MIKILQLILSSILISSCTANAVTDIKTTSLHQYSMIQKKPFYKNVNQSFQNSAANINKKAVFVNSNDYYSDEGIIFNWSDYTDTWDEFKANYSNLNLDVYMEIAFNWYNVQWTGNSFSVPLNNINSNDNWTEIVHVQHETDNAWRYDNTHGQLYYAVWVNSSYVYIRFKLHAWASNNNDYYYFTTQTNHVKSNSTFDYNSIYSKLNQNVNNKTLSLKSDTSSSLLDKDNIATEQVALDQLIKRTLDNDYETWKPFIADYTYSDETNQATITVKFNDPNTNEAVRWDFKVTIKFTLSQDYWEKQFSKRLKIITGKVIDPDNPNDVMIEDKPLQWEDRNVYSTTATIRFDGEKDGSETMKVNGVPIHVIDNTFTFKMTDKQNKDKNDKLVNEYDILLEKHDLNDFNKILGSYEFKYLIKQNVPNLNLKWYAWNPSVNPDQKRLIESTLPNGEPNPNYDSEVNSKTGTKTQIIWVKHKAENAFPLDPLDKNGDVIKNDIYDEGFLAEGSVSGMGIAQNFKDSWIKSVQRVEVDSQTLKPIGTLETIAADNDKSYFSLPGTYLYILRDQKNHTSNKFITIGQQWQETYAKFLDVLNNPAVAMPFWSTLQGLHLKNYLAKYKFLNSKDIKNLTFEQVSSYWKEYVSDVKSQHIGPDDKPDNNFDLGQIKFETIKINKTSVDEIKEEIIKQVQEQLIETNLVYNVDYELKPFDNDTVRKLLDYNSKGNALLTLNINALTISTRAIGTNKIKIINNINYDPNKVIDLKNIKFETQRFNFSSFTVEKLIEWIFADINQTFISYKISLNYPNDYYVEPLCEKILKQFLTSQSTIGLVLTIYSQDDSTKTKNSTTLELINDPSSKIAPPDPINPTPTLPDDKNSWINEKENLIIMTVISVLIIGSLGTIIFFKYRFKKGIGIKKNN